MINSAPERPSPSVSEEAAVDAIVRAGPGGALVVAGLAAGVVVALWLAFYFLVFLTRGAGQ
jgi:hypothetical protein